MEILSGVACTAMAMFLATAIVSRPAQAAAGPGGRLARRRSNVPPVRNRFLYKHGYLFKLQLFQRIVQADRRSVERPLRRFDLRARFVGPLRLGQYACEERSRSDGKQGLYPARGRGCGASVKLLLHR